MHSELVMLCVPRIRRSRCHALLAHTVARGIFAGLKFNLKLAHLLLAGEEGIVKRISARACPGICRVNGIFWRRGGDRLGHGGDWPFSCAASSSTFHRSVASCTLCTLFRHLRIQPAKGKQNKVLVAQIAAASRLSGRKVFVSVCGYLTCKSAEECPADGGGSSSVFIIPSFILVANECMEKQGQTFVHSLHSTMACSVAHSSHTSTIGLTTLSDIPSWPYL